MFRYKSKYKRVVVYVLPIWKVMAVGQREMPDEGPTLETLYFVFHIGSTRTFLYFDLYNPLIQIHL